jgi:hypothetical protein
MIEGKPFVDALCNSSFMLPTAKLFRSYHVLLGGSGIHSKHEAYNTPVMRRLTAVLLVTCTTRSARKAIVATSILYSIRRTNHEAHLWVL